LVGFETSIGSRSEMLRNFGVAWRRRAHESIQFEIAIC
jgi:hypothetical protein